MTGPDVRKVEAVALRAERVHPAHEGSVDLVLGHAGSEFEACLDPRSRPKQLSHQLPLLLVLDDPLEEERLLRVHELDVGHRRPEGLEEHPGDTVDADRAPSDAQLLKLRLRPACVPFVDQIRVEDREVVPPGLLLEPGALVRPVRAWRDVEAAVDRCDRASRSDRHGIRLPPADEEAADVGDVLDVVVLGREDRVGTDYVADPDGPLLAQLDHPVVVHLVGSHALPLSSDLSRQLVRVR